MDWLAESMVRELHVGACRVDNLGFKYRRDARPLRGARSAAELTTLCLGLGEVPVRVRGGCSACCQAADVDTNARPPARSPVGCRIDDLGFGSRRGACPPAGRLIGLLPG